MIYALLKKQERLVKLLQNIALIIFVIAYFVVVMKALVAKKVRFWKMMHIYHLFLMVFVFVLLTNYNTWYCLWLFPNVLFIRGKAIKRVLSIATGSQIAMQSTFLYLGERQNLGFLFLIILVGVVVTMQFGEFLKKRGKVEVG